MAPVPPRSFRDFATRRIILEKVVDRRLGHESLDPPSAWKWDYRYVVQDNITETLPFPGLKRSHLLSLPRSYWQNGPISGREGDAVKVVDVQEVFAQGRLRWAPVIHNGDLNIWREPTYFFSDDSVVETVDSTNVDDGGRSLHTLGRIPRTGFPILATIFKRSEENEFFPWRSFSRREYFSGIFDSDGVEQTTRDGDTFYWSNVDTTKREFVSYAKNEAIHCLFNKYALESITSSVVPSLLSDFNDLEYVGSSDGSDGLVFRTSYFPISNDSILAIYVVNTSGSTWTEYTIVEEFTAANQVQLDTDLGVLTFGDSTGSTLPPPAGYAIYIAYRATPRIEYEEEGYREESVVANADVSPLSQSTNRGFVTLARSQLDIDSIVLETTIDNYPDVAQTYGPIFAGSGYAPLLATVYSSTGTVVPNVEVTFFFETSPSFGSLGGSGVTAQRLTNFNGIARTFYSSPTDVQGMGFNVTSVDTGNILTLPVDANLTSEEDIYTYQVLKDDPLTGIAGADTNLGEIEWDDSLLNGRKVVLYKWNAAAINPISGNLGAYAPIRPSSITEGYILGYTDTLYDPDPDPYGTLIKSGTMSSANLGWIQDLSDTWIPNEYRGYVVEVEALNETRRILSNTDTTLVLAGEFSSLPTGTYNIFDKTDNLGGYWVVSDRFITLRASAYSPSKGRTIYSNILNIRVEIPEYMKGSYISSSLPEIPFGFRLIDDISEQASALDGATYISINPVAGPYPIVDVIGGETWDPYSGPDLGTDPYPWWPYGAYPGEGASAPFASFSFRWDSVS